MHNVLGTAIRKIQERHITVPAHQWKSEVLSWAFSCVTFAYVCLTELCLELDLMILEVAEALKQQFSTCGL